MCVGFKKTEDACAEISPLGHLKLIRGFSAKEPVQVISEKRLVLDRHVETRVARSATSNHSLRSRNWLGVGCPHAVRTLMIILLPQEGLTR